MKQRIECPYCDGKAVLQRETSELSYRKEVFKIVAHFYQCEKCKEEFTTTESDTISLVQAHNQYREKYNIPFPEEIIAIRKKYDLSASKMCEVLGLGANGYSNYENGEIPVPAYGNLISAAAEPTTFMHFLDNAKEHFSDTAFKKAKGILAQLISEADSNKDLCKSLNVVNEPNNYTGYRKPSPAKIANLVNYFVEKSKPDFNDRLKINKQLFFADFTHYKNYGHSISGITYRAIQFGPVPSNYDNIYAWLESEQIIVADFLKLNNGGAREVLVTKSGFDKSLFSREEMETISCIVEKFGKMSTWDVVELSHKEKAWRELEQKRELIRYQDYAFELEAV